jgi:aspartate-semialdehyde dehydrogenase
MVMVLAPLHRAARVRRVVATTYQAVSGTGRGAINELRAQVDALQAQQEPPVQVYPHRIAFNLFPHIGRPTDEMPGYYTEEAKMRRETRKILGDPTMAVTATCVRVPVYNAHSEALNVQLERKLTADQARELLRQMPGVVVVDDPAQAAYPMPIEASGKDPVYVGRIREDTSAENCLDLFCVSDNIRKGAALNAVQIAEKMIEMGLL